MGNSPTELFPGLPEPPLARVLSTLVERVYTCALDEGQWRPTIGMIAKQSKSQNCLLGTINLDQNAISVQAQIAFGPNYPWHQLGRYFARLNSLQVGTVATASTLSTNGPNSLRDVIGVKVLANGRHSVVLVARRAAGEGYGFDDIRLIGRLAPHISRSLAVSDMFHLKAMMLDAFKAIVDSLACAIYLTDRHGRVIYANPPAERLTRTGGAVHVRNDCLIAADPTDRATLVKAIAETTVNKAETIASGTSIVLRGQGRRGLIATVLPLNRGKGQAFFSAATAAIIVQDPDIVLSTPLEAFAKLYGLTAGELSVLSAMSPGLCVREVAESQRISEATAKTHLHNIFLKTGTAKQTELLHLFASYASPLLTPSGPEPSSSVRDGVLTA
jgi:PAS domain-containing protein/DNA-binding CsgD family transcriptional regulator